MASTILPPAGPDCDLPRVCDHDDEAIDWWADTHELERKTAGADARNAETYRPGSRP